MYKIHEKSRLTLQFSKLLLFFTWLLSLLKPLLSPFFSSLLCSAKKSTSSTFLSCSCSWWCESICNYNEKWWFSIKNFTRKKFTFVPCNFIACCAWCINLSRYNCAALLVYFCCASVVLQLCCLKNADAFPFPPHCIWRICSHVQFVSRFVERTNVKCTPFKKKFLT